MSNRFTLSDIWRLCCEIVHLIAGSCRMESVQHLLALMFIRIRRLSGPAQRVAQPLPRTIALYFLQSVELHLREHWSVAQYAAEIGVTPERLNATMRRTTGRPLMALIHTRLFWKQRHCWMPWPYRYLRSPKSSASPIPLISIVFLSASRGNLPTTIAAS